MTFVCVFVCMCSNKVKLTVSGDHKIDNVSRMKSIDVGDGIIKHKCGPYTHGWTNNSKVSTYSM